MLAVFLGSGRPIPAQPRLEAAGRMMLRAAAVQRARSQTTPTFEGAATFSAVALPADDWNDLAIATRMQI
jgi:hypothetical protein